MQGFFFHPVHGPHFGDPIGGAESSVISPAEFAELNAQWYPEPAPSVPSVVTPRQAKLALLSAGLLDAVDGAIDAIADPATKRVAQIEWEYAQEVRRDWPLLNAVAAQMGMTGEQVDGLFNLAATL